jgi:hypothetical protein
LLKKIKNYSNKKVDPILVENLSLKDLYSSVDRCFILATGPSIKKENLKVLTNEFTLSVSNFFVHDDYPELKSKFHIFAPFHSPITTNQAREWLKDAKLKSGINTIFVLSSDDKDVADDVLVGFKKIYYLKGGGFPVDFSISLPPIQTVVHISIYLAIYLGIKNIYLLGTDHSWVLHYGVSKHFYEENQHALVRENYSEWIDSDIGEEFHNNARLWDIYREIRDYSKKNGFTIVNLSKGSLLDIFPKSSLDSVV